MSDFLTIAGAVFIGCVLGDWAASHVSTRRRERDAFMAPWWGPAPTITGWLATRIRRASEGPQPDFEAYREAATPPEGSEGE